MQSTAMDTAILTVMIKREAKAILDILNNNIIIKEKVETGKEKDLLDGKRAVGIDRERDNDMHTDHTEPLLVP